MHPNQPWPPPVPYQGPLPTQFSPTVNTGRLVVPFIAMLVLFFFVTLLLGAILTGSTAGGIAIGLGCTAVLVGVLLVKFQRAKAGTVVHFTPHGIELIDSNKGLRVRMAWSDATTIGPVRTQMADGAEMGGGDMKATVGALTSMGLIGWVERALPAKMPQWMRDNLDAEPIDPRTGKRFGAIALGEIDPNWRQGAMGEWVRRYRGDLFR